MPWYIACLICAVCGLLAAAPFTDIHHVTVWFAFAPVCYVVAAIPTWKRVLLPSFVFGWCWLVPSFWFITPQTVTGMLALTLFSSLFYVIALLGVRACARIGIWSAIFGSAALWVLIELARSCMPMFYFPWNLLGQALWKYAYLRQAADLFGVYGLSFLVAAINATLAFVLPPMLSGSASAPRSTPQTRRMAAVVSLALLLLAMAYGQIIYGLLSPRIQEGPSVALIQGCEYYKIGQSEDEKQATLDEHIALHQSAANHPPVGVTPALICWAETMVPGQFNQDEYAETFREEVRACGVPTICGANWTHPDDTEIGVVSEQRWYNCGFILDGQGDTRARYAKRRLVAFGEYIPFKDHLPFLTKISTITTDTYTHGEDASPVVELSGMRIALNICVEDIYPDIAGEAARDGADVIFNLTNDAWFRGTSGPATRLQVASFRAIEVRIPMLRVTNSGHTAQIDPLGDVQSLLPPDTRGVAHTRVRRLNGPLPVTLVRLLGDVGVTLVFAFVALAAISAEYVAKRQVLNKK